MTSSLLHQSICTTKIPYLVNFRMDQPDLQIRIMQDEDIKQVTEIDRSSFTLPWPPRSFLFEIHENAYSLPLVAEFTSDDGCKEISGFLVVWIIIDEAHIGTIAVAEKHRKKGIAEKLMKVGLSTAAQKGALSALLEVRRSNTPAITMYEKLGFVVDGVRPKYYKDNNEDAILMSLPNLDQY